MYSMFHLEMVVGYQTHNGWGRIRHLITPRFVKGKQDLDRQNPVHHEGAGSFIYIHLPLLADVKITLRFD